MATKDWKKVRSSKRNEPFLIEYLNLKTQMIVRITVIRGFKYGVIEAKSGQMYQHLIESFKTKSKALKFVKSYMRKH